MLRFHHVMALYLLLSLTTHSCAQEAAKTDTQTVKASDVESIDGLMHSLYDVISGDKGQARDWNRLRSLFAPDARLIVALPPRSEGEAARLRPFTVDEFIRMADANSHREAFYENEVARRVDQFGRMANVWSTYESRREKAGQSFSRGINSLELFYDGKRWWIVSIYWTAESPDQTIPEKYLKSEAHR